MFELETGKFMWNIQIQTHKTNHNKDDIAISEKGIRICILTDATWPSGIRKNQEIEKLKILHFTIWDCKVLDLKSVNDFTSDNEKIKDYTDNKRPMKLDGNMIGKGSITIKK